jgi:deoxyribodipyrimidine photo-lyase
MKANVNIIWLKRDLRLRDHAPLAEAIRQGKPTLLIYVFEPSMLNSSDYDLRHWRFVWESLMDMRRQLEPLGIPLHIAYAEVKACFEQFADKYTIDTVFSYQETGLALSYKRDKQMKRWFKKRNIQWKEFQTGGVLRGIQNREGWPQQVKATYMGHEDTVDLERFPVLSLGEEAVDLFDEKKIPEAWKQPDAAFQPGGETAAWKYLRSFVKHRYARYSLDISKPLASRKSCSRLSPYITWGCLSVRQVFHQYQIKRQQTTHQRPLDAFVSRLMWQSHFIQKFEMEEEMEFRNLNSGYDRIRTAWNEEHYQAWAEGRTGFPLVDASMRCLQATGWVNFRMRAMLISFLTHMLWLDWKRGAQLLSRLFLDFEPGIHYPQVQMQAGTTGVNTYRIYNPVRQAEKQDPEAAFIKTWIPELRDLPAELALKPWTIGPLEQQWKNFVPGRDYPLPIIDLEKAYKHAQEQLWAMNDDAAVQAESRRVLKRHVNRNRNSWARVKG